VTAGALSLLACGELLGIEEAHVDPSLSAAGVGGGGPNGSGGKGGEDSGATQGGSPAGGGPNGGTGGTAPAICQTYCGEIMQWCSSAPLLQYTDERQCLEICSKLEPGTIGDEDVNTAACRLQHANSARYESGPGKTAACRWAGAGSEGACGTNCDGFCAIMMGTCTEESAGPYHYASVEDCLRDCDTLEQIPYIHADISVADSDTLQCRLYHVMAAALYEPDEHCEHAMGVTLCEPSSGGAGAQ